MALHLIGRIIVGLLSLALIYGTAITLLRSDEWWIRIFDFPRIQIAVLLVGMLGCYAALHRWKRLWRWEYALPALVGLALVWQLIAIAPYTALSSKEMADSRAIDDANRLSLLVYNVLSDNREVQALRDLIRDTNPDLILLSEPNQWWLEHLDGLEKDYPYTLYQPQENEYGKLLYSRLELVNSEVRFLIEPKIPSLRSHVRLRSETLVTLYGVHPRPPGLKRSDTEESGGEDSDNDDREDTDKRDAELLVVAQEVKEMGDVPVIVAGDMNDVAWSHTTHLFQRIGGLLDPRVGRGLFNTFDTKSRILRYPLDHVFASRHFLLVDLKRLPDIGSDHFPLLVVLDYNPDAAVVNEEPQSDPSDEREADEVISEGKSNE